MQEAAGDLSPELLAEAMPGREVHVYPSLVSTESDALARAKAGAPEGTVVVADYQISARSRPRRPWRNTPGGSLSFSLVLRPALPPVRGGWLYIVATAAVADVLGPDAVVEWPDEIYAHGDLAGRIGIHLEATVRGLEWALVNVMIPRAESPRTALLARLVTALEARARMPADEVLAAWLPRCATIGRTVSAASYPIGAERRVEGRAVGARPNGALLVEVSPGREVPVRPHDLASIDAGGPPE